MTVLHQQTLLSSFLLQTEALLDTSCDTEQRWSGCPSTLCLWGPKGEQPRSRSEPSSAETQRGVPRAGIMRSACPHRCRFGLALTEPLFPARWADSWACEDSRRPRQPAHRRIQPFLPRGLYIHCSWPWPSFSPTGLFVFPYRFVTILYIRKMKCLCHLGEINISFHKTRGHLKTKTKNSE